MGQRAFRSRVTDSLIKNYLTNKSESSLVADCSTSDGASNKSSKEDAFFQGKLIDLNMEFNVDFPLQDIKNLNSALSKGIINSTIPKGAKIKTLNLTITSVLFGEGKIHLHSNLYVLFGSHFLRDIAHINIKLYNPNTKKYYNDRKTIGNILDFMCFKTIKAVHINSALLFYVIPEYSEFAIVLAYKDINIHENLEGLSLLQDMLFHPYCTFERKVENFLSCLGAIEKTVPREVNNIILPIIYFNNLSPEIFENKRKNIFGDLSQFIKQIGNRFKIMNIEFKVTFSFEKENNNEENFYLMFINQIIEENYNYLKEFIYVYMSFDFPQEQDQNNTSKKYLSEFIKILKNKKLNNLVLAHHTGYKKVNEVTHLEDRFDYYDYVFYDPFYAEKFWVLIFSLEKNKTTKVIHRRKNILDNLLRSAFSYEKIFNCGRIDYSTELVKNKKFVPMEVGGNNVMVFSN